MNIYLENRNIIHAIGQDHGVDASVSLSMFDTDLRYGTTRYFDSYPDELREQYRAVVDANPHEVVEMTRAFYAELNRCIKEGVPFVEV